MEEGCIKVLPNSNKFITVQITYGQGQEQEMYYVEILIKLLVDAPFYDNMLDSMLPNLYNIICRGVVSYKLIIDISILF